MADDLAQIAAEAFVFGYPLVIMDVSRQTFLERPGMTGAPLTINELSHLRRFPDASFTDVVSPNADTLYSIAFLDLADEPVLLSAPASEGRYYLLPLLSGWTDVFASPGTRTTGNDARTFAVTGPGWEGELPEGVEEIRSPTAMVWLIGRTQTNGKDDYEAAHRFQDGLSLRTLSGGDAPPPAAAEPLEGTPPEIVESMDAQAFFTRLAELMVLNPPAQADAPALERFAAIGLAPGSFDPPQDSAEALDGGIAAAMSRLKSPEADAGAAGNGWTFASGLGDYGTDYAKRAFVAYFGLGANLDADAIYPHTSVDSDGQPLDGANRYRLRFEPGQTPPANAFWSLTMYDSRQYFVDNALDRYAIGDRDPLVMGDDGSLEIWLQHESPGPEREPNWLPAPSGAFNVILRIYWPKPEAIDGSWRPPAIERS